jgi:hypothetical protein
LEGFGEECNNGEKNERKGLKKQRDYLLFGNVSKEIAGSFFSLLRDAEVPSFTATFCLTHLRFATIKGFAFAAKCPCPAAKNQKLAPPP